MIQPLQPLQQLTPTYQMLEAFYHLLIYFANISYLAAIL